MRFLRDIRFQRTNKVIFTQENLSSAIDFTITKRTNCLCIQILDFIYQMPELDLEILADPMEEMMDSIAS